MSAEHAQREPTMEEILASIRRIISEDDRDDGASADVLDLQPPPAPAPVQAPVQAQVPVSRPAPAPEPARAPVPVAPVLEAADDPLLPENQLQDDLMVLEEEPAPVQVRPEPAPVSIPQAAWRPIEPETLSSAPVASQAAGSLSRLMGSMLVSSGATLDDVVRELLKPMLKDWLDANLTQIVEAEVAKEIDRIRRMAR
jgi:cell pole-organizing protein PopZ